MSAAIFRPLISSSSQFQSCRGGSMYSGMTGASCATGVPTNTGSDGCQPEAGAKSPCPHTPQATEDFSVKQHNDHVSKMQPSSHCVVQPHPEQACPQPDMSSCMGHHASKFRWLCCLQEHDFLKEPLQPQRAVPKLRSLFLPVRHRRPALQTCKKIKTWGQLHQADDGNLPPAGVLNIATSAGPLVGWH